ncbi:MAG: DUF1932 domain-containing protein [Pseudomonadota bacterium]
MTGPRRICLVGLGEVGQILADDLMQLGCSISAWDEQFCDAESGPARAAAQRGLALHSSAAPACAATVIIICAVTAAQTYAAADTLSAHIPSGAWFVDMNSAAPTAKQRAANIINGEGGRYIEAAVMSPIGPKRSATSMLLGGPHAAAFLPIAQPLGFTGMRVFSGDYGPASAAKMCRSVMIKGVEALLTEALVAARHYGVEETVIGSLDDLFPGPDWQQLAPYMMSRSIAHGKRRGEEMREVAKTIADAGIAPLMSEACAQRQDWADQRITGDLVPLARMLDALLKTKDRQMTEGSAS